MRVAAPSVALAIAQTSAAGAVAQLASRQSACSDVHVFIAKGNNEPYPGRQGKLVNAICKGLDSCDYENIMFYNPVESPYCRSIEEGVANGIAQLNAYSERCPDSKLVVSGYSQGAHIVSDILGGGSGTFFQGCQTKPSAAIGVDSAVGKKIAAALVFGNTRHTGGQPYNQLDGAPNNGIFPRPAYQLANLATWTPKYHDYCAHADPICAQGDDVADHLNYFDIYTDSAAAWVKSKLAAVEDSASTSSSSSSTSTSSSGGSSSTVSASTSTSVIVSDSSTITSVATVSATVPVSKYSAAPYAYSNATSQAPQVTSSAVLASIETSVLAIPTAEASASVTVTVSCASVDTSMIASWTSAYAATAVVPSVFAAGPSATGAAEGGAAATGTAQGNAGAANGNASPTIAAGAASSISGTVSGTIVAALLSVFALAL